MLGVQAVAAPIATAPRRPAANAGTRSGSKFGAASSSAEAAGPAPKKMQRAKVWSPDVENTFRLQEAGYRDLIELAACGQPNPELWPTSRFIKKLRTKTSLAGPMSLLYFREKPECGPKDIPKVKLYSY